MNKVFKLCDYGIPLSVVSKLKEYDVDTLEFESDSLIKKINGVTLSRFSHIKYILRQQEFQNDNKISLYELSDYGFDERQIRQLKEIVDNYNELVQKNIDELDISTKLKRKLKAKLGEIDSQIKIYTEPKYKSNFKELLLENIKELLLPFEKVSIIKLKNMLSFKRNYPIKNYINELNELIVESKIYSCTEGIYYKNLTIEEYLLTIEDSKKRYILYQKFKGKTLEEIAQHYDVTRERVRQILSKEIKKIPKLREDSYKSYFEKYEWNKNIFTKCFNESDITYNYLAQKYKMGKDNLENLLKADELPLIRRKNLAKCLNYVEVLGEEIKNDSNEILNLILYKKALKPISTEEFMKIYNTVVLNSDLDIKYLFEEIRNFEGKLQRSKYCLNSIKNTIRYYDIEKVGDNEKQKIITMLNEYDSGEYSTSIFFENNKDLMEELDISDEYELHNLLRTLDLNFEKKVVYSKMPHIFIGISNKKTFYDNILQMLSPDTIENITDYIYHNYGQKKESITAYLTREYKKYINKDIIALETNILSNEIIAKIRDRIALNLCSISKAKEIFEMYIGEEYQKYFNSYNLDMIGYKLRNSYIQKKEINNLDEYIYNIIKNKDIIDISNDIPMYTNPAITNLLKKYEELFEIVKINPQKYINIQVLERAGISKEQLRNYGEQVVKCHEDREFFTLFSHRREYNTLPLDDDGFEDYFYESLIYQVKGVKKISLDHNTIFYKSLNLERKECISKDFIYEQIFRIDKMYLDDFINMLNEEYGIIINNENKLIEMFKEAGVYYNTTFRKVYIDKMLYYNELYGEE